MPGMTTVPGALHFSLDVRAYDPAVLARLEERMQSPIRGIDAERRVAVDLGPRAAAPVGFVDPAIASAMTEAAGRLGIHTIPLGSPASHGSAAFSAAGAPTAMLFVRNEHGSHNPDEAMELDDFLDACAIPATWVAENVGAGLA